MTREFLYHFPSSYFWIGISGASFIWGAAYNKEMSVVSFCYYGLGNGAAWSMLEYGFHRYSLHTILYDLHHKLHHSNWTRMSTMFTPQWLVISVSMFLYYLLLRTLGSRFTTHSFIFLPLYYLLFEYVHLMSHSHKPKHPCLENIQYYHRLHHIYPSLHYGITTPLYDWVFGTLHPDIPFDRRDIVWALFPMLWFIRALPLNKRKNRVHLD